jgi:type IV pilus assembly protein PilE
MKRSGYTLLELLVVIAVIAIIATVGLVSYSGTQKKSRDTRRKEDLNSIALAMEQYFTLCGMMYPTPDVSGTKVPVSIVCNSQNIMATVPTDPGTKARYNMTGTSTSYSICAPNPTPMETESTYPYCRPSGQ